jgi:hypothetical protein
MVSACDSWLVHVEHIHSLHKLAFIIFVALYVKSFDVDFAYIHTYIYIYIASGPVAIMPPRTKAGDPEPSAKKTLTGWHVLAGSPHKGFCV